MVVLTVGFRGPRAVGIPDGQPGQVVGFGPGGAPVALNLPDGTVPPGQEGQVVGYGPDGSPRAVPAQSGPQGPVGPQGDQGPAGISATGMRVVDGTLYLDLSNGTSLSVVLPSGGGGEPNPQPITTLGFVLDGDSITDGYGVSPSYPTQLGTITGLPFSNLGVSGRTLATMDTTFASRGVGGLFNASGRNTLVILGGINDIMNTSGITLSALQSSMTSYLGKAKAAGFKVLIGLLPPVANFTTARETLRTGFNDWIRANAATLADGSIDLPAVPDLGDPENLYFYLDGLHPTKRGYARIAEAVRIATGAALVSDTVPTAFTFGTVAGAEQSTATTSAEIEIEGITTASSISITGGSYSINGAAFTTGAGTIRPYDRVRARVTSAGSANTATIANITIGGVSSAFTVTTAEAAPDPTAYVINDPFADLTGWTFRAFNSSYSANPISSGRGSIVDGTMRIMAASNAIYPQGYRTLAGLTIGQSYTLQVDHVERSKASAGQPEAFGFKIMVLDGNGELALNGANRLIVENVIPEETHTFQFTATQATHYLMLQAGAEAANSFNRFDNVRVFATPSAPEQQPDAQVLMSEDGFTIVSAG